MRRLTLAVNSSIELFGIAPICAGTSIAPRACSRTASPTSRAAVLREAFNRRRGPVGPFAVSY